MRQTAVSILGLIGAIAVAGCAGSSVASGTGGTATATIDGTPFQIDDVQFHYATGDDGYFRIEGNDAANREKDCVTGLGGGLALYGALPADVSSIADLAGRELPFEFSGDGDDFNLCFVGSNGLLGVESGTVRFTAVEGRTLAFSFSGSFARYDGEGGQSPGSVSASGTGKAQVLEE